MPERPHLTFPVEMRPSGQFAVNEQDSDAEVADCVAVILSWPIGTRQGFPEFGTPNELFQSGGPDLVEIREAVRTNEPRAASAGDEVLSKAFKRGIGNVRVTFDQGAGE